MAGIDHNKPFVPLKFAVLTISDTREMADDKSGATLSERIKAAGHIVFERTIVRDDVDAIRGGSQSAHIVDGRRPHSLLLELFTDAGIGTMVTP